MLNLYISPDTEKQKLMDVFCVQTIGASLEQRAQQYNFPKKLAQKMYQQPRYVWDDELEHFLEKTYLSQKNELEKAKQHFENIWKEKGPFYFQKLNDFFETPIPTYHVLVAYYLDVISNWKEENIVINYNTYKKENPLYHIYGVLFEIILSQVFIRVRKTKSKTQISDFTLWGISELSATAILNALFDEFKNSTKTGYEILDYFCEDFIKTCKSTSSFDPFKQKILSKNLLFE